MTAVEISVAACAALLLLGNAGTLYLWLRTRQQREVALDAVETTLRSSERAIHGIGEELRAVVAERDAARARAALAETRERISHAAWGRAIDKLLSLKPAPAPIGPIDEPVDWTTARGRHLVALDRQTVLHG